MNMPSINPLGSIYGSLAVLIAVIIIIIIILYIVKQAGKNKGEKQETEAIEKEVKDLEKAGIKPTLSQSKLAGLANNISDELSKAGWNKSDAFSGVYRAVLQVNNEVDLINLKKVYGIREIYNGLGNLKSNPKLTLTESIYLMKPNEVGLINTALAKKGIKNRF